MIACYCNTIVSTKSLYHWIESIHALKVPEELIPAKVARITEDYLPITLAHSWHQIPRSS